MMLIFLLIVPTVVGILIRRKKPSLAEKIVKYLRPITYSVASHSCWHLCKSLRGKAIGTSSMATGGSFGCATCCGYGTLRLGIMFDATTMETNQDNLHRGGGTEHSHTTSHTERNNGTARCRSKFSALNTGRHYCKFVSYDRDDYPFNKQEMLQKDTIH